MARSKRPTERSIPDTMNAAAIDRFGPPSVLKLHRLPVPHPGPTEVLIAIDTAGVGGWDASIRDGSWRPPGRQSSRSPRGLTAQERSSPEDRA